MNISARLKEIRLRAGLKQKEMAEKLGIEKSTYNGYEMGRRTPDTGTVRNICEVLSVDPNTLLGYESNLEETVSEYIRLIKLLEVEEIEVIKDFKAKGLSLVDVVKDLKMLSEKYK